MAEYVSYVSNQRSETLIENYIYLYHTDTFVILPSYPETVQETLMSTFQETAILSRSAPIQTYSYSGPRTVNITLKLHREMLTQVNYGVSNFKVELGDDYVDTLVNQLQAIALPKYVAASKTVNPPMVAVRFGNGVFIKGVVNGGIITTQELPLLSDGKYALVTVTFTVTEVDPYDAETVMNEGSLRGLSRTLERRFYKK